MACSDALFMDVQWVMQGYEFSFSGFFVEFLGFAKGIKKILPLTRLVKSSFRGEPPLKNPVIDDSTTFYQEMFAKEV